MSIVFMDGFDLYSSFNDLFSRGYTNASGGPSSSTRFGVGQSYATNPGGPLNFPTLPSALSAMAVGFALLNQATQMVGGSRIFSFKSGTTDVGIFGIDSTGAVRFARDSFSSNQFGISAPGLAVPGIWNYFEIEFTRHGTAGAFNIYMNGVLILSGTGLNTGAADVTFMQFSEDAIDRNIDDFYIVDSAQRLGECRIDTLRPTADTATKGFTPNSGSTNFSRVADVKFDGDSSYNSATGAGIKDLFDIADLATAPLSIFAVQAVIAARKDNTALSQMCVDIKSGATSVQGSTKTLSTPYKFFTDILQIDPATSAAWTPSAVNALQLGYEVVA
jgi:hypothetical protein